MVKQQYYSEMHSKNIEIYCLSYILACIICNEVHGKASVNSIISGYITNYVTCYDYDYD